MSRVPLLTVVVAVAGLTVASTLRAQQAKAELWFYAHCDETAEEDGDELNVLLSVDGGQPRPLPDGSHVWTVADEGVNRKLVKRVFEKELKPGEEVRLVLALVEKDELRVPGLADAMARAGKLFARSTGGDAKDVTPLLEPFIRPFGEDGDDLIAAFAVTLKNVGGKVEMSVAPTHRGVEEQALLHDENDGRPIPNFRARGEGSNYHLAFWQGGFRKAEPEVGDPSR